MWPQFEFPGEVREATRTVRLHTHEAGQVICTHRHPYDGVGRLTETNTGQITYSYDSNNKLTQLVGPGGTTTFGYDSNGNMTSMVQPGPVTTTYGYDYKNRLTGVTNPNYTAAYTYAADGLRLRVQESNNPNPDRWMQYDGVRPVLEGTLNSEGNFTTLNKYVWEGNGYYDPLVYSLIGGAWRYHMYDGVGSTRQLMLHASPYTVTDTYSYEAFGNLLSSTGSTANPYRYVGSLGYYQTGNDLMHLGARYYMPEVGRLCQADPAKRGDSRYAYVGNGPLNWVDPTGEVRCDASFDGNQMCIYAGANVWRCWQATSGNGNPADQGVCNRGPIPEGWWSFPSTGYIADQRPSYAPGKYPLSPEGPTNTYGRSLLRIHGGVGRHAYPMITNGCIRLRSGDISDLNDFVGQYCTGNVGLYVDYSRGFYGLYPDL